MIDLFLPLIVQHNVTFSPPPSKRVAAVYRYLAVRKDAVKPDIIVKVGKVDSPAAPRPGQTVVALWHVVEQIDGTAVVTIARDTGRKEIARAIIEALD